MLLTANRLRSCLTPLASSKNKFATSCFLRFVEECSLEEVAESLQLAAGHRQEPHPSRPLAATKDLCRERSRVMNDNERSLNEPEDTDLAEAFAHLRRLEPSISARLANRAAVAAELRVIEAVEVVGEPPLVEAIDLGANASGRQPAAALPRSRRNCSARPGSRHFVPIGLGQLLRTRSRKNLIASGDSSSVVRRQAAEVSSYSITETYLWRWPNPIQLSLFLCGENAMKSRLKIIDYPAAAAALLALASVAPLGLPCARPRWSISKSNRQKYRSINSGSMRRFSRSFRRSR